MGRHVDLQFASDNRRPIRQAERDDTPMAAAGFHWNDDITAGRWEIELNGYQWHLHWESGGLVAQRKLATPSGPSTLKMKPFPRPETVADAEAIRARLTAFSGGAS